MNEKRITVYIKEAALFPRVVRLVCVACHGRAARGGLDIEGVYYHRKCHDEACH